MELLHQGVLMNETLNPIGAWGLPVMLARFSHELPPHSSRSFSSHLPRDLHLSVNMGTHYNANESRISATFLLFLIWSCSIKRLQPHRDNPSAYPKSQRQTNHIVLPHALGRM